MTFSILGFCRRANKAGFCQATSTPAVGWRCTDVVHGRGIVTVQAHSDYRQLKVAKDLMQLGLSPAAILKHLRESDPIFEYRQIAILDLHNQSAVYTGKHAHTWAGEIVGTDHIATGNVLAGENVVQAMSQAFLANEADELEERLLKAVEAGRDAGGQPDGQTSSALVVYGTNEFPIVNLRIDASLEPVGELRKVFDWFKHLIPYYIQRTIDPGSVPRSRAVLREKGLPQNPYES
jgi:uncharacterized Ntn-hydrolase superfamily protein